MADAAKRRCRARSRHRGRLALVDARSRRAPQRLVLRDDSAAPGWRRDRLDARRGVRRSVRPAGLAVAKPLGQGVHSGRRSGNTCAPGTGGAEHPSSRPSCQSAERRRRVTAASYSPRPRRGVTWHKAGLVIGEVPWRCVGIRRHHPDRLLHYVGELNREIVLAQRLEVGVRVWGLIRVQLVHVEHGLGFCGDCRRGNVGVENSNERVHRHLGGGVEYSLNSQCRRCRDARNRRHDQQPLESDETFVCLGACHVRGTEQVGSPLCRHIPSRAPQGRLPTVPPPVSEVKGG